MPTAVNETTKTEQYKGLEACYRLLLKAAAEKIAEMNYRPILDKVDTSEEDQIDED